MNTKSKNLFQVCRLLEDSACANTKWRPKFHLSPRTGWMNDPNGLCRFGDTYHIFFQYSPYSTCPGTNFWGHFTTDDFVSYEYHKPAICVDEKFDCHGVYSGSAIVKDSKLQIFYTGNVKLCGDGYDYITAGREHNTVTAFSNDGLTFPKKRMLMANSDYPDDVTCHVRDPKVFERGGSYYMVLGARTIDDIGQVLVYKSEDALDWKLHGRFESDEKFGFMWECPDLYELDGQWFLAVSPQGVDADGIKYNNIYQSGYFPVDGFEGGECKAGEFTEIDRGFDFYAPQSFSDNEGRRIMIGWLGLPDLDGIYENPTHEYGWMHMLTVPRVLTNRGGKLYQQPIEELAALRRTSVKRIVDGDAKFSNADVFELYAENISSDEFTIEIKNDCKIRYADGLITLSFGESGRGRTSRSAEIAGPENIRVLCDTSAIEIFVNDGAEAFASRFYPEESERGVKVIGKCASCTVWELGGFEIKNKSKEE